MAKRRRGSVKAIGEYFVARVRYTNRRTGVRHALIAKRRTKSAALDALPALVRDADKLESGDTGNRYFEDIVDHYKKFYAVPPEFDVQANGARIVVAGVKSWRAKLRIIDADLLPAFRGWRIEQFTFAKIDEWRLNRWRTPVVRRDGDGHVTSTKARSMASVHRPLEVLSHMFAVAIDDGIIAGPNPCKAGRRGKKPLIQRALEGKRTRIPTVAEEDRLLAAFAGDPRRERWIPRVIAALDTDMRRGEIDVMTWRQVDFERGALFIVAPKVEHHAPKQDSERGEDRIIVMTDRLRSVLEDLRAIAPDASDDTRVFPTLSTTSNRAWRTACRVAGISNLRFNDLRHVLPSRLSAMGMDIHHVRKLMGHTTIGTTVRYVNVDLTMQREATARLERYRSEQLRVTES
jgi:integrase